MNVRLPIVTVSLAALLGAIVSPAVAVDEDSNTFRAYGVGPKKCALYVQLRERKLPGHYSAKDYENTDEVVAQWVAGFLTAHNYYVKDTFDVTAAAGKDKIMGWLEWICRRNPDEPFAAAVEDLAFRLHPRRLKDAPSN
jgi:hypothetical protein